VLSICVQAFVRFADHHFDGAVQEAANNLINIDLHQVGRSCLPDDVNRAAASVLRGNVILQLVSVTDVSKPTAGPLVGSESGSNRLLVVKMTDGQKVCKGVEFHRMDMLSADLAPGTKLQLHDVAIKTGVLHLEPKSVNVIGGQVESLVEEWKVRRLYAGIERTAHAGDVDEKPPSFRQFIPARDNDQLQARKPDAGASGADPGQAKSLVKAVLHGASAHDHGGLFSMDGAEGEANDAPEKQRRTVAVEAAAVSLGKGAAHAAARQKLLDAIAARDEASRSSRGSRRRVRGRQHDEDADDRTLTLEEWEARQRAGGICTSNGRAADASPAAVACTSTPTSQLEADEALARQLQEQLMADEQDAHVPGQQGPTPGDRAARGGRGRRDVSGRGNSNVARRGHVPIEHVNAEDSMHGQRERQAGRSFGLHGDRSAAAQQQQQQQRAYSGRVMHSHDRLHADRGSVRPYSAAAPGLGAHGGKRQPGTDARRDNRGHGSMDVAERPDVVVHGSVASPVNVSSKPAPSRGRPRHEASAATNQSGKCNTRAARSGGEGPTERDNGKPASSSLPTGAAKAAAAAMAGILGQPIRPRKPPLTQ